MVNDQDRQKILAFVHGELDQLETQKLAARIEAEDELRREFESLLATSDSLEDLFLKPAEEDLSPRQIESILEKTKMPQTQAKRSPRSFFIAGGAVFAASLAFVLFMKMEKPVDEMPIAGISGMPMGETPAEERAEVPAGEADQFAAAPAETPPPAQQIAAAEAPPPEAERVATAPVEPVEKNESDTRKGALSRGSKMAGMAKAKVSAAKEGAALKGAPQKKPFAEDTFGASASLESPLAEEDEQLEDEAAAPPPAPPAKKMGVIASKAKFSANLNRKKALLLLQQRLDGKPSCVPVQLASVKVMQAVITLDKNGLITKIKTTPHSPDAARCLKAKLTGKPAFFKTANKKSGQITIQLKNY